MLGNCRSTPVQGVNKNEGGRSVACSSTTIWPRLFMAVAWVRVKPDWWSTARTTPPPFVANPLETPTISPSLFIAMAVLPLPSGTAYLILTVKTGYTGPSENAFVFINGSLIGVIEPRPWTNHSIIDCETIILQFPNTLFPAIFLSRLADSPARESR